MKVLLPAGVMFALITFLVGLNLRPVLAAVGPLFPLLQSTARLSATQFSLLTTLPVAMMGLAALAGPTLLRHTGAWRGIAIGLFILALAAALRVFSLNALWLIATALLAGAGIGMIQALIPTMIKRDYARSAGTLMSLFSTGIMAGAALAAASAAPAAETVGIHFTLAAAALPAIIALGIWLTGIAQQTVAPTAAAVVLRTTQRAWLLLIFFGIGTAAYTLVLAWLPTLYIAAGWSARSSGYLLAGLTLTEVAAGFMVSLVVHRFSDRRPLLMLVLLLLLAGLICLIGWPGEMPVISTLLLGLGIGALFPLSLTVTLDHAATAAEAGKLLARVQGGGYLIAATMPVIAGVVRDRADSLNVAWLIMSAGVIVLLIIATRFRPLNARQ